MDEIITPAIANMSSLFSNRVLSCSLNYIGLANVICILTASN
jgi:H2-forming N5,N10-methylenetetrahydromethanopterin dehydrogenase-like enzyme